ncbi:hypothetical protein DENIS_1013 [Desulfonema ishimotonii]|uniref:YcaO domain-containing protein n=1 Tax=Desulfonema ishimotonii TaxID=45657 RepID=A0A401FSX7_9BACT|nr:YcaO-like family protein [Desulfonema ishimotonii]GBC60071.1 hypothetical protein DENIS_1013 [Desulfonema ishimotonii]
MSSRIVLNDAFKQVTQDQDKIMPPEQTVRRFKEKLEKLNLNILDRTVRIDNGRLGIPVYFSQCGPDALAVTDTRKQMGKGATPQQAEASAVMELAERFSFFSFYKNEANFVEDQYRNIRDRAIPFEQIARSVHDTSEDADRARQIFEKLPLRWTPGYNLTRDREVLIPCNWFFAINEFNGACAGNCPEEALCQGISEVVERHVSAIVSRNRRSVPAILPASATDPVVREMLAKYQKAGIRLHISDFTLDTGIPTVGVLAWDPATFPEKSELVWTAGTAPDPQKAMSRALSETAQLGGDFNTGSNYMASGLPKFSSIEAANFITHAQTTVSVTDLPDLSDNNIRTEIRNLLTALSGRGMDVLAVNTTHPQLGVPAFYTIIPGAHFRERSANSSVGMFCAKLVTENNPPPLAILELKEIGRILPDRYYVQFYLGTAWLETGDPETAATCLERALDLEPAAQDIPSIYSYLGVCLKEMGRYREALTVLKKGDALDPDRTDIHNLMGFCHFKLKAHEEAIASFKNVLRLNPGSGIDYANIAVNYREMDQKEKAVECFEIALALDPSLDFARESLEKLTA